VPSEDIKEIDKLKIIYYEIIAGCSHVPDLNIYIKHFSELDNIELSKRKQYFLNQYLKDGIPSYKDRIKVLIDNEEWSAQEDENINFLKTIISDNERNVKVIKEQQYLIHQIIKDKRQELNQALFRKRNILGATAEEFADRETLNYMAFQCIFKDSECKHRLFATLEDFQSIEDSKSDSYTNSLDIALNDMNEQNIRRIASMPFFINIFSYVKEDVSAFFKKPMFSLSNYQFLLISLGSRNLGVLSATENDPPEIITDDDIQKRVDFFDLEYSVLIGKRKNNK
jgi:hypothetical protein